VIAVPSRIIRPYGATGVVTAAILSVLIAPGDAGHRETARQPTPPLLPLRLTALAVGLASVAPGTTAKLEIDITRWSSTSERDRLAAALTEQGPDALLSALREMPFHGHMSIPRWFGPDPHQARLGWDLRYATHTALDKGEQRIAIATDRFVGFWETRDSAKTVEYPFTLIDIRLDKHQRGTGKMSVAAKIDIDRATRELRLENYASEPVRLTDIRMAGRP
jgi:hypothetical protein